MLITAAVVVSCWEADRLGALLALAGVYGVAGACTVLWTVYRMRAKAAPFASSLAELRKDGPGLGGDA